MPFISIIIPNYNHAPYLTERIESVLNQTYQNFEVIILDDCSTDNSREIIETYYNHPKISHIIFNDQNSGSTFKQWEKGINIAKGDWIWIAESDDFCEPTLLKNLIDPIINNANIGISYCQSVFVNYTSNALNPYKSTDEILKIFPKENYIEEKLIPYNSIVNASMAIFRKDLFFKITREFTKYRLAGDWIFWAEMSRLADVAICGKFLNYFRQHDIKVSNHTKKEGLNYIEEIKALQYFKSTLMLSKELYEEALIKHYFRFKYNKFPFKEGVIKKTDSLFKANCTIKMKSKIKKQIIHDKILYQYIPKLLKLIS